MKMQQNNKKLMHSGLYTHCLLSYITQADTWSSYFNRAKRTSDNSRAKRTCDNLQETFTHQNTEV